MDSKETLSFVAKLLLIWTLLAFILAFIAPVLSVVLFLFLFVLGIPALMIAMWGRSKQLRQQQSVPRSPNRTGIPSAVKQRVWRRDVGRCVECGSNENLEYNHIIPVSKGDSNTERNVQLLCMNCNLKKHAKIM